MKPIIEVKDLSKEYKRGAQKEQYLSLREQVFKSFKSGKKKDKFWALKDINFDVYPGDSLAIIGKNGAGKSTLLKILSKITPPTRGEIIVRGRLASLLEVGTGFHPELTGRENIYLNGSILGLGRQEINRQFDAIVDFSGVDAFLDTPLKHYSSGMQLRLAFSVAAHLEPEILVIDEVLAVGDSVFQQKCIDKMTEVSQSGRTLIFVSHNMQALKKLCESSLILSNGSMQAVGDTEQIVSQYLRRSIEPKTEFDFSDFNVRTGNGEIQFYKLTISSAPIHFGQKLVLSFKLISREKKIFRDIDIGVAVLNKHGDNMIHMSNRFIDRHFDHTNDNTVYSITCDNILRPGRYCLTVFLRAEDTIQDWVKEFMEFDILDGNPYGFNNSLGISGAILPTFEFASHLNYTEL